jgi:hypothetical protein
MLGEADSDRLANTATPASYECHLVVQTKAAHLVAPLRSR